MFNDNPDLGLKLKNYKCFGDEWQGFERILPINIIIGRNNAGKSSLLDMVYTASASVSPSGFNPDHGPVEIKLSTTISESEIAEAFSQLGMNSWSNSSIHKRYIGGRKSWSPRRKKANAPSKTSVSHNAFNEVNIGINDTNGEPIRAISIAKQRVNSRLFRINTNPFSETRFRRIASERDIRPEPYTPRDLSLLENGEGATNLINTYLSHAERPHNLVEKELLEALNKIFEPDAHFIRIKTQSIDDDLWEIFLDEKNRNESIALSKSGSGLKTVLLVLTSFFLIPDLENKELRNYLFGFEELENNLHPALQRRLFAYIRDFTLKNRCHVFLTTHSNVVIDLFSRDEGTQIVHVTQTNDGKAIVDRVETYAQTHSVLDDLAVRASDLLQANCIVWLEGPSDRIYFNRWINLWSDGKYREGIHYQCVFFGGSLLAHLSADAPDDAADDDLTSFLKILRVNRNCILLTDSDKDSADNSFKNRVVRIQEEMTAQNMYCWITEGREIENYIPHDISLKVIDKIDLTPCGQFDSYEQWYQQASERKTFSKTDHASMVARDLTRESLEGHLDLSKRLNEVCECIQKWNAI